MGANEWDDLIGSLYDQGPDGRGHFLPGACLLEWLTYVQHGHDEVDALYTEAEVLGG